MTHNVLYHEYSTALGWSLAIWNASAFLGIISVAVKSHRVLVPFVLVMIAGTFFCYFLFISFVIPFFQWCFATYPDPRISAHIWFFRFLYTVPVAVISTWFCTLVFRCYKHLELNRSEVSCLDCLEEREEQIQPRRVTTQFVRGTPYTEPQHPSAPMLPAQMPTAPPMPSAPPTLKEERPPAYNTLYKPTYGTN